MVYKKPRRSGRNELHFSKKDYRLLTEKEIREKVCEIIRNSDASSIQARVTMLLDYPSSFEPVFVKVIHDTEAAKIQAAMGHPLSHDLQFVSVELTLPNMVRMRIGE